MLFQLDCFSYWQVLNLDMIESHTLIEIDRSKPDMCNSVLFAVYIEH